MWQAVAGEFAKGFGQSLASPGGPSNATGRGESRFDSSGWNVAFGSGSIDSKRSQTETETQSGSFDQYLPYILAAAGVLIVWRLTKR